MGTRKETFPKNNNNNNNNSVEEIISTTKNIFGSAEFLQESYWTACDHAFGHNTAFAICKPQHNGHQGIVEHHFQQQPNSSNSLELVKRDGND
jgi:hypothetical protein